MLRIIIISVVCFVCTSVNGQNQNVVEKKIPHLYFPYEQVEKNSVQVSSASIIVDTDNDGVLDEFDKEINSPIGFPVDVFGVSMDSDNDGCLDAEDMEPFSSQIIPIENCINVENTTLIEICRNDRNHTTWCLPYIMFEVGTDKISDKSILHLKAIFEIMDRYPRLKMQIIGHISAQLESQYPHLALERAAFVTKYLTELGISEERFVIRQGIEIGLNSSVDLPEIDCNVAFNVIN